MRGTRDPHTRTGRVVGAVGDDRGTSFGADHVDDDVRAGVGVFDVDHREGQAVAHVVAEAARGDVAEARAVPFMVSPCPTSVPDVSVEIYMVWTDVELTRNMRECRFIGDGLRDSGDFLGRAAAYPPDDMA